MTTADRPEPPPKPPVIQSGKFSLRDMEGTCAGPWKPTKAQVHAAALAIARLNDAGWRHLTQAQRDDYLIDAHAGIVAAHRMAPLPVTYVTKPADGMVCMSKEHADAYTELLAACDEIEKSLSSQIFPELREVKTRRVRYLTAIQKLHALASPERIAP